MTALPITWATKLIERLHMMYGAKFSQQWEGLDKVQMAQFWAEELAGFTGEEIRIGLQSCKSKPWPPTLPEFMQLCRPWLSPEVAHRIAVTGMQKRHAGEIGQWPHPAIYWAAVEVGTHDMLNQSWQTLKGRWSAAYDVQLAKRQWEPIPEPAKALPAPGKQSMSSGEVSKAIKKVADSFTNSTKRDPKAWARKILDNPAGKSVAVIDMAKRALEEVSE